MEEIEYWPNLEQAWKATSDEPAPGPSTDQAAARWRLVKSEPRVRVILLQPPGPLEPVVCKVYKIPGQLAWRTLGMASRANREFTALMEAHRNGLPVARPRYWVEERRLGGVSYCAIALDLIPGINLEEIMKRDTDDVGRKALAREAGVLLARLHHSGLQWGTAFPRNIMLHPEAGMIATDMPYARSHDSDITGSDRARGDIRQMLRCKNQDWGFDAAERTELLLGYCSGDAAEAKGFEPLVEPRSTRRSKVDRFVGRSTNLLSKAMSSPGKGGLYCVADGTYRIRNSGAISAI